jgi:uncharacterized membrane protein YdfJ with MMPL/SSD domain
VIAVACWVALATVLGVLALRTARRDRRHAQLLHSLGVAKGHRRATRFE